MNYVFWGILLFLMVWGIYWSLPHEKKISDEKPPKPVIGSVEFEKDIVFIKGYLKQAIKMNHPPGKTAEILLFLTEEIEKLKSRNRGK